MFSIEIPIVFEPHQRDPVRRRASGLPAALASGETFIVKPLPMTPIAKVDADSHPRVDPPSMCSTNAQVSVANQQGMPAASAALGIRGLAM